MFIKKDRELLTPYFKKIEKLYQSHVYTFWQIISKPETIVWSMNIGLYTLRNFPIPNSEYFLSIPFIINVVSWRVTCNSYIISHDKLWLTKDYVSPWTLQESFRKFFTSKEWKEWINTTYNLSEKPTQQELDFLLHNKLITSTTTIESSNVSIVNTETQWFNNDFDDFDTYFDFQERPKLLNLQENKYTKEDVKSVRDDLTIKDLHNTDIKQLRELLIDGWHIPEHKVSSKSGFKYSVKSLEKMYLVALITNIITKLKDYWIEKTSLIDFSSSLQHSIIDDIITETNKVYNMYEWMLPSTILQ